MAIRWRGTFKASWLAALVASLSTLAAAQVGVISTVVAGGVGDGKPPREAVLRLPGAVAVDAAGNLVVADRDNHRIRKVTPAGVVSTVAGTGAPGFSGDGGLGIAAQINGPQGVAVDAAGNVYFSDSGNQRVRKVDPSGIVTTVAGTGVEGFAGDGAAAVAALLSDPFGLAIDAQGALLIADRGNYRVRKVAAGVISTVAGNGSSTYSGDGVAATATGVSPWSVAPHGEGGFYVADPDNRRVLRVNGAGVIETVAGGHPTPGPYDGMPARNAFLGPVTGVSGDGAGNVYLVLAFAGNMVAVVDAGGTIRTFAGTGMFGFGGDGGPPLAATLASPIAVATAPGGAVYIADAGNGRVRRVQGGIIDTVLGGGSYDTTDLEHAALMGPSDAVADLAGNLYIADTGNDRIRHVGVGGAITSLRTPPTFSLRAPESVVIDGAGGLYVADSGNHQILRLAEDGYLERYSGFQDQPGFSGDGGPAASARMRSPRGLSRTNTGGFYFADSGNHRVRVASIDDVVQTVAGNGSPVHGGDGGPPLAASFSAHGTAQDAEGNLYIADGASHRIRKLGTHGTVMETVAGTGVAGFSGDGGPAVAAELDSPSGLFFDNGERALYIADSGNHRIRRIDAQGNISTVAGTGQPGYAGDGGPATAAMLSHPRSVRLDLASARLLVADSGNNRIRAIRVSDRIPSQFSFPTLMGVAPSTVAQSASVVPTGYDAPATIGVTGGEYSIGCAASFTAAAGTIVPGQSVCVRHTSAAGLDALQSTILTIGGVQATFTSRTRPGAVATLALTALPSAAVAGQAVTFRVVASSASGTPSGTITIADGNTTLCSGVALVSGAAQCSTPGLALGEHAITASYHDPGLVYAPASVVLTYRVVEPGNFVVTVSKSGAGGGRVTSAPAAIDCGTVCSATFTTVVDLVLGAEPSAGSAFYGWSGGGCAGFGTCTVATSASQAIDARFGPLENRLVASPDEIDFGRHLPGVATAPRTVSIRNIGTTPITVSAITLSDAQFTVVHDCATLSPAGNCTATLTLTAAAPAPGSGGEAPISATLTVANNGTVPSVGVSLRAVAVLSLVEHFYRAILRRAPEPGGKAYWEEEASRLAGLGANRTETLFAMAGYFFNSAEYLAYGRSDEQFIQDLYNTFFNRLPDDAGGTYWRTQLSAGMPREVLMLWFMFSTEFRQFTEAIFGAIPARPEVDLVMDLYRGILNRLPETPAFEAWVRRLREAQCAGPAAATREVEWMAWYFVSSEEYVGRSRSVEQFVSDLYYAFLRRGGDLSGFRYWVDFARRDSTDREQMRRFFMTAPEFVARMRAVAEAGCVN